MLPMPARRPCEQRTALGTPVVPEGEEQEIQVAFGDLGVGQRRTPVGVEPVSVHAGSR